jgi:hypothetical protein
MSNQQQNDTRTPKKGAPGNASHNPDPGNQGGQKPGQESQQRRDAHSNSSSAGKASGGSQKAVSSQEDDSDDVRGEHSSTKNLETEPDRARQQK